MSTILRADIYQQQVKPEPFTKASGNLTTDQFFDLMYWTLNIEKPDIIFAPSYPQYLIPSSPEYKATMENPDIYFRDTITYLVIREEPGSVGGDKQPFGDRRELVPRYREYQNHNDHSTMVYGQWFDTLVKFDIWSLNNYTAEKLAIWFKRFMSLHRDFFKDMGLSEILFWWRGEDKTLPEISNRLQRRSLIYYIRTEEISIMNESNLKELKIKILNSGNYKEE